MNEKKLQVKWYFRTSALVILFLCIGPLVLPLVWFNPHFGRGKKIIISTVIVVISYYLGILFVKSLKSLKDYYELLQQLY